MPPKKKKVKLVKPKQVAVVAGPPPLFPPLSPSKLVAISHFEPSELEHRRDEMQQRLECIHVPPSKLKPPLPRKSDTHRDFLLKELSWLSADFQSERNRHQTMRKKLCQGLAHYWESQERRRKKALQDAAVAQRKKAKMISRIATNWWGRLEKVLTAQQQREMQQGVQQAMNQELVKLVKQTEAYTKSLVTSTENISEIEKALQQGSRRSRGVVDYNQMQIEEDASLYGESTASEGESDEEYSWCEQKDDETTLALAEEHEKSDGKDNLRKLQEEATMDIEQVMERLKQEGEEKTVRFAESTEKTASEEMDKEDGEFEVVEEEKDDETTIAAEERLGRDMTHEQEMELLQKEGEIPVEQLRAIYAGVIGNLSTEHDANDEDEEMEEEDQELDVLEQDLTVSTKESHTHLLLTKGRAAGPKQAPGEDDDEFQFDEAQLVDDETTIAAEERLGRHETYEEEITALENENNMSIEELRAKYAGVLEGEPSLGTSHEEDKETRDLELLDKPLDDQENDGDFEPEANVMDDETTIAAEERIGGAMKPQEEIDMLTRESEIPIEELRRQYQQMMETDDESSTSEEPTRKRKTGDMAPELAKRSKTREAGSNDDDALATIEQRAQLAENTIASRPFLLSAWVKLREYQQIGLNWLVSLQSRRLNGILADEMGLGKTLQTIALFSYLASYKGIWGPHLVVVPTSVIVNWETELKRFCPGFKILCYYGSSKRRKELRTGWTKSNWYHVVITSYQLAVQDEFAFKRKKWYYMVLDEAQNIKNFQSKRWQTLINFNTQRRLLLTGTPLQNSLMELWSLLHFLMPYIFRSRKEFSYWFANPMTSMIDGTKDRNDGVIARLHGIIRPFVLRRLKKDVETQMPGKYEHIVRCQLSRRQMFIYEEFMARSSTRTALKKSGNFMGMMNVLMQLRKVCNHPDLFEPRSIVTPFVLQPLSLSAPVCVTQVRATSSALRNVSERLLCPLWSGSQGLPSLNAALRHDFIESLSLRGLFHDIKENIAKSCNPDDVNDSLLSLLNEKKQARAQRRSESVAFLNDLNAQRCQARCSLVSSRLLEAVAVGLPVSHCLSPGLLTTPQHLLHMKRSQEERASDMEDIVKRFVFCVPKASVRSPVLETLAPAHKRQESEDVLQEAVRNCLRPFRKAEMRLSSFFPDKKLVQFDAGKLQTLAGLLRELKRGNHRALIFTQMSKMLDILEGFLNLNGHTYLRLDGSTGVDQRQRLMDRFNNDNKVFCMILSTRSGGMGVNLTGADSVIFYDSDWNPAMDAQAQDRAHRIGQTRDVHIYRLVTQHTIEENILIKAQQKKNLDILVMDKGNFDANQLFSHSHRFGSATAETGVLTAGGLRAVLGVSGETEESTEPSNVQMESAMASLEDADDVIALKGATQEAKDDLKEFDETIELEKDDGEETVEKRVDDSSLTDEQRLEKEIAMWQGDDKLDVAAIEAALSETERYGLKFRKEIDPFYSIFAVIEYRRKLEAEEEANEELDIDELENQKAIDEEKAIEDGDILGTHPSHEDLIRQRNLYFRERSRLKANKKRRRITGENWEQRVDGRSGHPFWLNVDTGESTWEKPVELLQLEEIDMAQKNSWAAMPLAVLKRTMGFLNPYPDRMACSAVSKHWKQAATDISFVRHVYPVEMGAYTRDDKKMDANHFRTIAAVVAAACPGDTIELGDGHYWLNEDLSIEVPLRIVGDEHNPSNVVVETGGKINWTAGAGWCEGVTFRRPRIASGEPSRLPLLTVVQEGKIDVFNSIFDNEVGGNFAVQLAGNGEKGTWRHVLVKGGMCVHEGASLTREDVKVSRQEDETKD